MSLVRLTTLPNGFRIVTEAMPGLASAAVGVWVDAGARHEAAEENGIAHFLEHMAFKGTTRRSALAIAEEIEDVGGHINAYTSREITAYYARVLAADVPLALDVIGDILLNSVFDPREIEVERGVILQEIGQALDTPDDVIFDWLQEAAYPAQPLGRSILGPSDRVSRFARADFQRFVARRYGPERMILAAAGAVDHDRIVAQAGEIFAAMAPLPSPGLEPARFHCGERREFRDMEQAHVAIALEGPAYHDDDYYAAQVFATALGGGMSSRLFQKLREERGLCYTIFAQAGSYADTGTVTFYAGTGASQANELTALMIDELRRAAGEMSEAEVLRARAQLKAGLLMGLEGPSARAERLARSLSIWGRVPGIDETVARIEAVGRAEARAHGQALCSRARAALAVYGPVGTDAPDVDRIGQRLAA